MKKVLSLTMIFTSIFCFVLCPNHKNKSYANANTSKPKLAIVIDDFGSYDQSGVATLSKCKQPLTCAVIPFVDNTQNNIKQFKALGHEIILHMPMSSHVNLPEDWYGPTYIKTSDSPEIAKCKINECLNEFQDIKGFNMHIGSGVSRNKSLMSAIYDFAKDHNLYFLDSRTIETPIPEKSAIETNSIYLGRDVFLEADKNRSYQGVCNRLYESANLAKEKGYAIAIGHVGAEGGENTAQAILNTLPKIEEMGIEIVPLSQIYETLKNK